jgi:hypothetical protein
MYTGVIYCPRVFVITTKTTENLYSTSGVVSMAILDNVVQKTLEMAMRAIWKCL